MAEMVPELTNGEFEDFFRDGTVLVNFFAEWCMPCMMMGPIVEDLKEDFLGKAKIGRINIEDNPEIVRKFEVTSVPCFILFKQGKPVDKIVGGLTQDELSEFIEKHL